MIGGTKFNDFIGYDGDEYKNDSRQHTTKIHLLLLVRLSRSFVSRVQHKKNKPRKNSETITKRMEKKSLSCRNSSFYGAFQNELHIFFASNQPVSVCIVPRNYEKLNGHFILMLCSHTYIKKKLILLLFKYKLVICDRRVWKWIRSTQLCDIFSRFFFFSVALFNIYVDDMVLRDCLCHRYAFPIYLIFFIKDNTQIFAIIHSNRKVEWKTMGDEQ